MTSAPASSLAKALGVLDSVARLASETHPATVSEIVAVTGLDKAQVSRMLSVFVDFGFVERVGQRKGYRLGWNSYLLGRQAQVTQVAESIRPYVDDIGTGLHESAYYSILSGTRGVTLVSWEPDRRLYAKSWDGLPFSLVGSAVGCTLLVERTDADVDALYDTEVALADATTPLEWSREQMLEMVATTRETGYCRIEDEHGHGISTVAVAVPSVGSAPPSSLSVTVPAARFDGVDEAALARLLDGREQVSSGLRGMAGAR